METISNSDIVISGFDGRFPKSKNMEEFAWNLYNKIDTSTEDEIRWSHSDYPDLPRRAQYIDDIDKFDAELFKFHPKQVEVMDPQGRILLETAYSAILDAGVHPATLRGSNTGVFVANTHNDMMARVYTQPADTYSLTGAQPTLMSSRISYAMDFRGPSFTMDSACSSSMYATLMAVNSMLLGQCDAAIVCGANLILNPNLSAHMVKMGVLSSDGTCWSCDSRSNGYARAETISVMFLQRRKDAKRIYGEIVHILGNNDGYKSVGLGSPSGEVQSNLFTKLYREVRIDPLTIKYVEAHATGTVVGDREECFAIDKTFCEHRTEPLLVGAIKPNMGHSEGSSALCSIAKVIHSFETGMIPATIHIQNLRKDIPSLIEGRLSVCRETTALPGPLVAVNSFGFGGSNGHILLKQWHKEKVLNRIDSHIPSLIVWAGRTEQAVSTIMDRVKSVKLDREFIGLLHQIQRVQIPENRYRGFGIFEDKGIDAAPYCLNEEICCLEDVCRPIVWLFSGMGCQWIGMGKSLMQFRPFYNCILKCQNILKSYSIDLISIITTEDSRIFDQIVNSFVGITAIQLALVDLLKLLEIPVDYIIGHSNGELVCAYADGAFTLEQALLSAYFKGKVTAEGKTIDGLMAAVGMGYNQIKDILPSNIYVACHNSADSCTVSGLRENVLQFIEQLKLDGVFVKEVNTSGIAYHSKYVSQCKAKYMSYLQTVVSNRVVRSSKWISSSIPSSEWHSDLAKYNSAEYHVNNMLSPVLFEEACSFLPKNSIIIEVAPHGLLQAIMKRSFPDAINVPLTQRNNSNNVAFFLAALGRLFNNGICIQIDRLYSEVEFPVSRGTPMIAPLIKYDHEHSWSVPKFGVIKNDSFERKVTVDISQEQFKYLAGNTIDDDRCAIAGSTYIYLVWETLALFSSETELSSFNVELTNVRYLRRVTFNVNSTVQLSIVINTCGNFEVIEGIAAVFTGVIKHHHDASAPVELPTDFTVENSTILNKSEIYKELQLRGCTLSDEFRAVESFCWDNKTAKIKWNGRWETFIEAVTHIYLMSTETRAWHLSTAARKIKINAVKHSQWLASVIDNEERLCDAFYCQSRDTIVAGGIEITGLKMKALERRKPNETELLEIYHFVPLIDEGTTYSVTDAVRICVQLIIEKLLPKQLTIMEYLNGDAEAVIDYFRDVLNITPLVNGTFKLLYDDKDRRMDAIEIVPTTQKDNSKYSVVVWNAVGDDVSLVLKNVSEQGFLIMVRNKHEQRKAEPSLKGFSLISIVQCAEVSLVIFQHEASMPDQLVVPINSKDHKFTWLKEVQRANKGDNVLLLSDRDESSGVLGFLKSVRYEPNVANFRCVIIDDDKAPPFDIAHTFYRSQLMLGLPVNIFRNGKWGTCRQLALKDDDIECVKSDSLRVEAGHVGHLQSLEWIPRLENSGREQITIKYVGLDKRDVILASSQTITGEVNRDGRLGREYSGIDVNGRKVMGTKINGGALATRIESLPNDFLFSILDFVSLEEAASMPIAYLTAYAAFFTGSDHFSDGPNILIHNGCSRLGLAAIRTALAYGINVYTTVSSRTEKSCASEQFPELSKLNIVIPSSESFGCYDIDTVLSYTPEVEMVASIEYLKKGGTLILVEPFDIEKVAHSIAESSKSLLEKGISLKTISLEELSRNSNVKKLLTSKIIADLKRGVIKPLPSKILDFKQMQNAFSLISSGEVNENIVIAMPNKSDVARLNVRAMFIASSKSVYIITGGLGGIGLELVNWLIMRGAETLILCSRYGPTSAYQLYRLRYWKSLGCNIVLSKSDITSVGGCQQLLHESNTHGSVAGIFCLAGLLYDNLLLNQTEDRFKRCLAAKAYSTQYLDELSRTLCPKLEHFVVFSSVISGRGAAGQTNYAMANSIIDRVVENRVKVNLPGKSIQWGPVSDVGIIARMIDNKKALFGGLQQQGVDRCLHMLDKLLFAKKPIVSSIQIPEKNLVPIVESSIFVQVLQAFGIKDVNKIRLNVTLGDFGIDSLIVAEVVEILEREANVKIPTDEIKSLTVEELKNISDAL